MSIFTQIFLGSVVLGVCSLIHILILVWSTSLIKILHPRLTHYSPRIRLSLLLGKAFGFVVMSHSIQVWIWALSFMAFSAIPALGNAVYFSLVTYTALGYGDITLDEGFRIYAAMGAVTGLLNFGLSTAFLVGLFGRLLPRET